MGAVFVSYRRGDSEGQARALYLELARLLGKEAVFMDVDSIALGEDFRQALQQRLESCDVMIALIGPGWLDASDAAGRRRLELPTDFVRQEIAAALKRNIPVIPVLVQGAQIPSPDRLPEDVKDLSYRNGFELGHSTWESDVREMVTRLGLKPPSAPHARPAGGHGGNVGLRLPLSRRWLAAAAVVAMVAVAGLLVYTITHDITHDAPESGGPAVQVTPLTQPSPKGSTVGARGGGSTGSSGASIAGVSAIEFTWPGGDCWDIYRGTEFVAYQCGAKAQALQAGTYTIKGKFGPVFEPFDVDVREGAATRVQLGGVFRFEWPGKDCWDIYRGDTLVAYHCGTNEQALQAGTYTIKGKFGPVFVPFDVQLRDGASTRVQFGGIFRFEWPGGDCWDIYRGDALVAYHCGTNEQALQAGTYSIKGKFAPVFKPFQIEVKDGARVQAP